MQGLVVAAGLQKRSLLLILASGRHRVLEGVPGKSQGDALVEGPFDDGPLCTGIHG